MIVISSLVIVQSKCHLQKQIKEKIQTSKKTYRLRLNEKLHYRFAGGEVNSSVCVCVCVCVCTRECACGVCVSACVRVCVSVY